MDPKSNAEMEYKRGAEEMRAACFSAVRYALDHCSDRPGLARVAEKAIKEIDIRALKVVGVRPAAF